jgi:DNA-binding transcriptional ArsR family regulator
VSTAALAPADVFRAISDPTRRAVLDQLREGETAAGEIARRFEVTASAISQHLRILLEAGLIRRRRDGRRQLYALTAAPLRDVAEWTRAYEQFWTDRLDARGEYLAREDARAKKRKPR